MSEENRYLNADGALDWDSFAYDRDTTIAAITSLLTFLGTLYIPGSAIKHPPESGWPSITEARFAPLGKTPAVLDLLAHIPYISAPNELHGFDLLADTRMVDWASPSIAAQLDAGDVDAVRLGAEGIEVGRLPARCVALARGTDRSDQALVLDTRTGVVYWWGATVGNTTFSGRDPPSDDDEGEEDEDDDDAEIKSDDDEEMRAQFLEAPAWPVQDFVEVVKARYRELKLVPVNNRRVIEVDRNYGEDEGGDRIFEALRSVYREHGWPGDGFDKAGCARAVEKVNREQFDESYQWEYGIAD